MKKSKKVLLSAAIAAAIMGSVSLPQIQAADISDGIKVSTSHGALDHKNWLKTDSPINGKESLAKQSDLEKVNSEAVKAQATADGAQKDATKANYKADAALKVTGNGVLYNHATNLTDGVNQNKLAADKAQAAADKAQAAADKAQKTADSKVDQAKYNQDKALTNAAVQETKDNLNTFQKEQDVNNKAQRKDIEQNKNDIKANASAANKAQAAADKAQKTADSKVDQAKYNQDKALTNAAVQETKDTLTTFQKEQNINNEAQRKDINQNKNDIKDIKDNMKDSLANAAQATNKANSAADKANKAADNIKSDLDKKVDKTQYNWDKAQTNAAVQETKDNLNTFQKEQNINNEAQRKDINQNKQDIKANASAITKETNDRVVADNALSDRITNNSNAITKETNDRVAADTVLSNRISDNSSAIQSLRHDVSDLGTEIDNVGAISAALAGLHPLDWNGSGSKFQLSAAAGTYDGKQAMALGGFYHPNRNMLLSLGVSSSLGSDRKTAGNVGITFRVGKGSNGTVSDDVAERLAAMDQKISQLESQNQKLTSILAIVDPSLTKEFPDVPANHWAYEAVSKLAGNGIVEGYPDGDFHGDRTMTRYEMAQVIYKALKKGGSVDQKLVKEFNKEIEAVKANDAQ